jgi:predicted Zn-dependent protease
LARFVKLLDKDWRQPTLWTGLVDAAASVKTLPPDAHKELFLHIYDQVKDAPKQDAMFLSRLGWVLRRLEEPKKCVVLLKLALDQEPGSREIRTHLAEALNAAGDYAEAEKQFQILLRTSARQP